MRVAVAPPEVGVAVAVAVGVAPPPSQVPLLVHQFHSGGVKALAPVAQQIVYFEPPNVTAALAA